MQGRAHPGYNDSMLKVDLHCHSNVSDGVLAPAAGSATSLASRNKYSMASQIWSSSTRTTSSTKRRQTLKLYSIAYGAPRLSATVSTRSNASGAPEAKLRYSASAPNGSTPYTAQCGLSCLTAAAMPAHKPPPPTGTTTASRAGTCAISSSPTVPVPCAVSGPS